MKTHTERAIPVEQALIIAENAIAAFGLTSSTEAHGEVYQTFRCQLREPQHQSIYYGFGKGLGLQSKASACYEALEHFAVHHYARNMGRDVTQYQLLPDFPMALPCVKYQAVNGEDSLIKPLFTINPRYAKNPAAMDKMNYQPYSAYVSDNGIASGTNFTEASIHALNELIERDAHSLFLIEGFVKNKNQCIRLIDKSSLPANLQKMVNTIEQQYNDVIMLFDITTEFNIPVMYASMTRQPFLIQPSGCGASLSAEYALERALLEMLQPLHIHNHKLIANQQQIVNVLTPYPLLLNAALANVSTLAHIAENMDWHSISQPIGYLSLALQLKTITDQINQRGFKIYYLTLAEHASGFTAMKYHIPELEDFHLVQTGKKILPASRGRAILNA